VETPWDQKREKEGNNSRANRKKGERWKREKNGWGEWSREQERKKSKKRGGTKRGEDHHGYWLTKKRGGVVGGQGGGARSLDRGPSQYQDWKNKDYVLGNVPRGLQEKKGAPVGER